LTLGARAVALALLLALLAGLSGAPQPQASPRTAPGIAYFVKSGDTLFGIAGRHGVTIASLVSANRLAGPSVRIRIGQLLAIPASVTMVARAKRLLPAVSRPRLPAPPRGLILAVPDFAEVTPSFAWPVEGYVTSAFGRRRAGWHRGIDIKADFGIPVAAAAPGTVVSSGYENRYGRVVKIEHMNGFMTVYAHNNENLVEVGDRVTLGQTIAAVGRTGRASTYHVHFEIRQAGLAYNPLYMLPLPPRVAQVEDSDEDEHEDADD